MDDFLVKNSAQEILNAFYIKNPDDIDLEIFASHVGATVLYEPLKNAEAMLVRQGDNALIYVDPSSRNRGRIRFAIGHEIGHLRLHAGQSQAWLCHDTSRTLADYHNSRQEIEANIFAAHLLMPPRMFGADVEKVPFSVAGISRLADRYSVSFTASARRFVDESRDDIMVVMSESGRIKWFHSRVKVRGCFVRGNQAVPPESDAIDCAKGSEGHANLTRIDPMVWFPELAGRHTVYEQSFRLGGFPWVLTLIAVEAQDEDDD